MAACRNVPDRAASMFRSHPPLPQYGGGAGQGSSQRPDRGLATVDGRLCVAGMRGEAPDLTAGNVADVENESGLSEQLFRTDRTMRSSAGCRLAYGRLAAGVERKQAGC